MAKGEKHGSPQLKVEGKTCQALDPPKRAASQETAPGGPGAASVGKVVYAIPSGRPRAASPKSVADRLAKRSPSREIRRAELVCGTAQT